MDTVSTVKLSMVKSNELMGLMGSHFSLIEKGNIEQI